MPTTPDVRTRIERTLCDALGYDEHDAVQATDMLMGALDADDTPPTDTR